MVEILFTKGLIQILFTTETFAMGVNAPAKAVVFSNTRKHDGQEFRNLLPGEYTQMSGRAGRRGLDDTGVVIVMCGEDTPEVSFFLLSFVDLKHSMLNTMMLGKPTKLTSQFRLTYNMILNLLRVEALKIEDMMKRSFSENGNQKLLPDQQIELDRGTFELETLDRLVCETCLLDIGGYFDVCTRVLALTYDLREKLMKTPVGVKSLSAGRIVIVNNSVPITSYEFIISFTEMRLGLFFNPRNDLGV